MFRTFRDRREAGRLLASLLPGYAGRGDVVVLALPRGGVPVAYEIAVALGVPLDVFTVRKLGVPGHEEFAMGALASGGISVLDEGVVAGLGISHDEVVHITELERQELERRERLYRDHRTYPQLEGKNVILVDDGVATGASMLVAVKALRQKNPAKIIVAVPVGAADSCALLRRHADDVICYRTPEPFGGVGAWYDDFSQVGDDEVRTLLNRAALRRAS
ncbi:MAG: phosphoribosyltransferase [Candidatus Lustribacter sp.]